jgi:serine/threonine protein kinase
MSSDTPASNLQTLAQRMEQGKLPVEDALRYSITLADALRRIHDTGRVHGAVYPGAIVLTGSSLELLPGPGAAGITPYTAPEVLQGRPADPRSDVFSFGAILYEMVTGCPAFRGETPEALAAAIIGAPPPTSGSPAVDQVVGSCLAKDPAARVQRIQRLALELKLLAVALRRAEASAQPRREEPPTRMQLEQLELRLTAQLDRVEHSVQSLVERLAGLEQRASATERKVESTGAGFERIEARIASLELAAKATAGIVERLENNMESLAQGGAALSAGLESVRTAVAQTDNLVEHVVEALESVQTIALEQNPGRAANAS